MHKVLTLAVVGGFLLATPVQVPAQLAGSVDYLLNYARKYLAEGQPSSAASYAKEVLALDSNNSEALAILQKTQSGLGDPVPVQQAAKPVAPIVSPSRNGNVGSVEHYLEYARGHVKAGNLSAAVAYARDALKVDATNVEAQEIIRASGQGMASKPSLGKPDVTDGNSEQVGSAAYLLKYARHHLKNGSDAGARDYAIQALKVDSNSTEAKRIIALVNGRRPTPPSIGSINNSCQTQFSACWSGATTFKPGSGYAADPLRRQQCFAKRNLCNARVN